MTKALTLTLGMILLFGWLSSGASAKIETILAENVDDVIAFITDGGGTAKKDTTNPFDGNECLQIDATGGDGQKYNATVPGWSFKIVENPSAEDEFRYITFAWRKDGGEGIQLQLHGNPGTWGHRYHAGANVKGWNPSIQISDTIPTTWQLNTEDLFADWGEFELTGIAFTAWDGNAGFWDDVMLHQRPDEPVAVQPAGKLAMTWAQLKTR